MHLFFVVGVCKDFVIEGKVAKKCLSCAFVVKTLVGCDC